MSRNLGRLAEYPGDQRGQVINTIRDAKQGRGPLHSPIISEESAQQDKRWMAELWRTFEDMGIVEPHDIQSFINGSTGTNLVQNTNAIIATFTMPEQEDGFLTDVWVNVNPPGSFIDVVWTLMINGGVHPQFNQIPMPALNQWTPFKVKLDRGQKIDLVAFSSVALPPLVTGMIKGWGRLIPDLPT
jgi:hypothetical protein